MASKIWLAFFSSWLLFLTGIFATPGLLQASRLQGVLELKRQQLAELTQNIQRIRTEADELKSNPFTQEREIRKTLGYTAEDELVFDFGDGY